MIQQSEIHPCVVAVFGESRYAVPVGRGGGSGVAGVGVDVDTQNLGGKWTTSRRDGSGLWKTWKVGSAASRTAGKVRPGRSSAGNEFHREFGKVQVGQFERMEPARQQSLQCEQRRWLYDETATGATR